MKTIPESLKNRFEIYGLIFAKELDGRATIQDIERKEEVMSEIIKQAEALVRGEIEKAFGGCTSCYGKGYATNIDAWSGKGEHDMVNGHVIVHYPSDYYLPCKKCQRGKDIEKLINHVKQN